MTDSQERRAAWLANLPKDDRVIVHSHYMNRMHVRRVTTCNAAFIWIDDIRYDRKQGSSQGHKNRDKHYPATLEMPTKENLRKAEFSVLLSSVRNVDWSTLSVESLRLVAQALQLPHNESLYKPATKAKHDPVES